MIVPIRPARLRRTRARPAYRAGQRRGGHQRGTSDLPNSDRGEYGIYRIPYGPRRGDDLPMVASKDATLDRFIDFRRSFSNAEKRQLRRRVTDRVANDEVSAPSVGMFGQLHRKVVGAGTSRRVRPRRHPGAHRAARESPPCPTERRRRATLRPHSPQWASRRPMTQHAYSTSNVLVALHWRGLVPRAPPLTPRPVQESDGACS